VWGAAEVPHGTSGPAPGLNHPETAVPLLPVGLIFESSAGNQACTGSQRKSCQCELT
jgi:hypothetical protein